MAIPVNVDDFAGAESDRVFASFQRDAGGVNLFTHNRAPTPVDQWTVIRMNRDTLYGFAVADISDGATVTIPDGDAQGPARAGQARRGVRPCLRRQG
jgi:hypothetical protein